METSAFLVLQMLLYGEADTLRYNEEQIRSSIPASSSKKLSPSPLNLLIKALYSSRQKTDTAAFYQISSKKIESYGQQI
jgi:hypothetical protein